MWRLARDGGELDLNSSYAYLVLAEDFASTCRVAVSGAEVVGFLLGYQPPERTSSVFVWQVAVRGDQRGRRLARRMLDLEADPVGIDAGLRASLPLLAPLLDARPGVRLPGTPSLAEALLWAVVGQQITTDRARALLTSATDLLGTALPEAMRDEHIHRLAAAPALAAARAEEWFRGPGARRRALTDLLADPPDPHLPLPELRVQLLARRGIGPWTADYALLRGARAIDAAPARDVALLAAARDLGLAEDFSSMQEALAAASPWRSYAVMHLFHHRDTLPAERRTLRKDRP